MASNLLYWQVPVATQVHAAAAAASGVDLPLVALLKLFYVLLTSNVLYCIETAFAASAYARFLLVVLLLLLPPPPPPPPAAAAISLHLPPRACVSAGFSSADYWNCCCCLCFFS
jgi:hypothetical protein